MSHSSCLMVQGTTSDAGKSMLVTAFCRILARHKKLVAPFKPQNMSLNSAVTIAGGEIGRAQAVQAQACYLQPTVDMNPVLLKPNTDIGAQVIVRGRAIGNQTAQQYHKYKEKLLPQVIASFKNLQRKYKNIIIEGAGSPAEINLTEHDIANMGFASAIECPVILIADIDRGGVFAQLWGTYNLLEQSCKSLVRGFVINRFRGDVSILKPGLDWLQKQTGIPVLGVIPYIPNLHLEAEDSASLNVPEKVGKKIEFDNRITVCVILYPRVSNHTDFDPLRLHPQVNCQFIRDVTQFRGADLIILPGSKQVRGDLQWLRKQGWEKILQRHLRYEGKVLGICGGFQMLGQWIFDPHGIESSPGKTVGLGFFDFETTLTGNKTLRKVQGFIKGKNVSVVGYEIHAGISKGKSMLSPLFELSILSETKMTENEVTYINDGAQNEDNTILGTYLHGLFDCEETLDFFLQWVSGGNIDFEMFNYLEFRENQINHLASIVESVIPVSQINMLLDSQKHMELV